MHRPYCTPAGRWRLPQWPSNGAQRIISRVCTRELSDLIVENQYIYTYEAVHSMEYGFVIDIVFILVEDRNMSGSLTLYLECK